MNEASASADSTAPRLTRLEDMRGSPGAGGIRWELQAPTGGKNSGWDVGRPAFRTETPQVELIRCGDEESSRQIAAMTLEPRSSDDSENQQSSTCENTDTAGHRTDTARTGKLLYEELTKSILAAFYAV